MTHRHRGRGLLQFENVSYGIEPLGYSPAFEHFVYRVSDEKMAGSLLANSHPERGPGGLTAEEMILTVTYLEVSVLAVVLMSPSHEEGSDPAGNFVRCHLDGQRWGVVRSASACDGVSRGSLLI